MSKKVVIVSMGLATLVGCAALVDMITAIPFGKIIVMDVTFILAAGIVGYMAYDSLSEMK
jgi:hypothetical protein